MTDYFADSNEEKYFKCARCGAALFDADNHFAPTSEMQITGNQFPQTHKNIGDVHIDDNLEIICTQCGQHLGLVSVEDTFNSDIPMGSLS